MCCIVHGSRGATSQDTTGCKLPALQIHCTESSKVSFLGIHKSDLDCSALLKLQMQLFELKINYQLGTLGGLLANSSYNVTDNMASVYLISQ
jgi:hypothetical protein